MSSEDDYRIRTPEKPNFILQLECVHCDTVCSSNAKFKTHQKRCLRKRTCKFCNVVFENGDKLISHILLIHGSTRSRSICCKLCKKNFRGFKRYTYHIRSVHYNLSAKTPLFLIKKVNDVWFERVHNTNIIVELHKTKPNALLIKKYTGEEEVQIEENTEVEDLSHLYPTKEKPRKTKCQVCEKMISKKLYKKHYESKHKNFSNFECVTCKATFKRSYWFNKHICPLGKVIKMETFEQNTE